MFLHRIYIDAGWSSLEARRAHNPKVIGSNPVPATHKLILVKVAQIAQSVEQRTENPRVTGSIPVLGTLFCKNPCNCLIGGNYKGFSYMQYNFEGKD